MGHTVKMQADRLADFKIQWLGPNGKETGGHYIIHLGGIKLDANVG